MVQIMAPFFSAEPQCIHGIQMLPYSAISESLLPQDWVQEQFPFLNQTRTSGWEDIVDANEAIIQPIPAWSTAFTVGYGSGTTLADTLYWAATRPANGQGTKCTKTYPPTPCNGACCAVQVEVDSAGLSDGNYVNFKRDYRAMFPHPGRGFNVAVLDKTSRSVLQEATFDTYGLDNASDSMVAFINNVGVGQVVLVAILDSVRAPPASNVIQALTTVGAKQAANIALRCSYALIGVKGGNALKESVSLSGKGPAQVTYQFTC